MSPFALLVKTSPNKVFFAILVGAIAGLCYSGLIPLLLSSIFDAGNNADNIEVVFGIEVTNYKFALSFFTLCTCILFFRALSQVLLVRVALDMAIGLRASIYDQIIKAPVDKLDEIGKARLMATIVTDVGRIVQGARVLPDIIVSVVTLVGLLGFLLYLSAKIFWVVIASIIIGGCLYQIPIYIGNRYNFKARGFIDDLHESLRGLIYGVKELKLNRDKRAVFFAEHLIDSDLKSIEAEKTAATVLSIGINFGDLISFYVIAVIAFVFISYHLVGQEQLVGIIMALLYITGPIAIILNSLPQIMLAKMSLQKVIDFQQMIPQEAVSEQQISVSENWHTLRLTNVSYQYGAAADPFTMGPVNMEIAKGELVFLVGGNGSGKSTLAKILALHYMPTQGTVSFGDTPVNAHTVSDCREFISAIFTDFYLFKSLLAHYSDEDMAKINDYIVEFGLDHKVSIEDGEFSTIELSDGQKKRLALILAFIEDRDIYIFDEWAADQDPVFKQVFYFNILPRLRTMGKVVIVISHDDRYFHLADKVYVMEDGKMLLSQQDEHYAA
jgi:putative ATP-binding cassette transporter